MTDTQIFYYSYCTIVRIQVLKAVFSPSATSVTWITLLPTGIDIQSYTLQQRYIVNEKNKL